MAKCFLTVIIGISELCLAIAYFELDSAWAVDYKKRNTIDINDFGAKGDGTTDNTLIIQEALNSGKNVRIPTGVFLITNTLTIQTDGQEIFGSENSVLKLAPNTYKSMIVAKGKKNLRIHGFKIDGNGLENTLDQAYLVDGEERGLSQETACIFFEDCTTSTVERIAIKNAFISPVVLKNCVNSIINRCESINHNRDGFGLVGGKNNIIKKCVAESQAGFPLAWSQFFTMGLPGDNQIHGHKLLNNTAKNSQAAFISVNTRSTFVSGNLIIKTSGKEVPSGPGLRLGHGDSMASYASASNSLVKNNIIRGMQSDRPFAGGNRGISADNATGTIIKNNTIENCETGIGVSVTVGQAITTKNNILKEISEQAIDYYKTIGGEIVGNNIEGCTYGIIFQGGDLSIKSNKIVKYTLVGIWDRSSSREIISTLSGNTIRSNIPGSVKIQGNLTNSN